MRVSMHDNTQKSLDTKSKKKDLKKITSQMLQNIKFQEVIFSLKYY